ncbi:MAG: hypothetical protein ACK502_01490 [Alphaproteobacteria bacterium]
MRRIPDINTLISEAGKRARTLSDKPVPDDLLQEAQNALTQSQLDSVEGKPVTYSLMLETTLVTLVKLEKFTATDPNLAELKKQIHDTIKILSHIIGLVQNAGQDMPLNEMQKAAGLIAGRGEEAIATITSNLSKIALKINRFLDSPEGTSALNKYEKFLSSNEDALDDALAAKERADAERNKALGVPPRPKPYQPSPFSPSERPSGIDRAYAFVSAQFEIDALATAPTRLVAADNVFCDYESKSDSYRSELLKLLDMLNMQQPKKDTRSQVR